MESLLYCTYVIQREAMPNVILQNFQNVSTCLYLLASIVLSCGRTWDFNVFPDLNSSLMLYWPILPYHNTFHQVFSSSLTEELGYQSKYGLWGWGRVSVSAACVCTCMYVCMYVHECVCVFVQIMHPSMEQKKSMASFLPPVFSFFVEK